MPRLTPEQRAELERQLADDDQAADEDDAFEAEWWEELPDGTRRGGRLPWKKAKGIYGKYAPDLFGDKPPDAGDGGGQGQGGGGQGDGGNVGYFGKRKASGQ